MAGACCFLGFEADDSAVTARRRVAKAVEKVSIVSKRWEKEEKGPEGGFFNFLLFSRAGRV